MLEGSGWGSTMLKEARLWPQFNFKSQGIGYLKLEIIWVQTPSPDMSILANVLPSQLRWKLVNSQQNLDGGEQNKMKKHMANRNKKPKQNFWIRFRKWNNRIPKIYHNWITGENSSGYTIPFLGWKSDLQWSEPVKKIEAKTTHRDSKKLVKNQIKMKTYHNLKCKTTWKA